jgi:triphosphoribosyl-dephospho-CoA synthase
MSEAEDARPQARIETVQSSSAPFPLGQCATLACLLEATAAKPGNVHRGSDFDDLTYLDFAVSAAAIGPVIEAAMHSPSSRRLGALVLSAVEATRQTVATNTNLGTVLLIAPLALVPRDQPLTSGIQQVLHGLNADDTRDVYAAIRLAQPGGLGKVPEADIHARPPDDLLAAMRLAADRDLVARQYTNNFAEVLGCVVPWLEEGLSRGWPLGEAIIHVHLRMLSEFPDSLIARKCGPGVALEAAANAASVLSAGVPGDENYHAALADLDFWLRSDHHRRNPGTTADLIAAGLFAALREGVIRPPFKFYG